MTARGLRVLTLAFPDPDIQPIRSDDFQPVDPTLSYSFTQLNTLRTLSTNGASGGRNIDGLLFTPDLPTSQCPQAADIVPPNATRPENLPDDNTIYWIALAPWISSACTIRYLDAVQMTQTQAFLFYLTDNSTTTPPPVNDPAWSLGDGGRWKSNNRFPVYAVPSIVGQDLMSRLAEYSGNITSVPNGRELVDQLPSSDYVRLAAEISIDGGSRLPSLWIFLLIVLGILIIIIGATSCSMHCVQRRRREQLQRRVAAGEVDLEALGIKRLTVPQEMVDKLPLYTYSDGPDQQAEKTQAQPPTETSASTSSSVHPHALHGAHFSQATCPICLEDYVSGETTVRELPCRHLFHPECVDSFLVRNSSLCPMCKKSVLPKGHCPAMVTNAMVRRERMVRLRRQNRIDAAAAAASMSGRASIYSETPRPSTPPVARLQGLARRVFSGSSSRRIASTRQPNTVAPAHGQDVEMQTPHTTAGADQPPATEVAANTGSAQACPPSPETTPPTDRQGRREWARQRAVSMVGQRQRAQESEIEAIAASRPLWRRAVGRVFPAFA